MLYTPTGIITETSTLMSNPLAATSSVEDLLKALDIITNMAFDEEYNPFPENPVLAQSYVPWQVMDQTFKPHVGLRMGTIFPELVSPYMPGQSMAEIEYIRRTNKIGEGCNK